MVTLTADGAGLKGCTDFLPFSILLLLLLATLAVGQEAATPPSGWTPEESMKVKRVDNVQVSGYRPKPCKNVL